MATRGRPRRPPTITARQQAYLAALPALGGKVAAACRSIGLRPNTVTKWRNRSEPFKAEEDRIRQEIAEEAGELSNLRIYSQQALRRKAENQGIGRDLEERWQKVYLLVYQKDKDRIKACKAVSKAWTEVKDALAADEPFRKAVQEIEEELEIQLYDAQRRRAIETGDATAANAIRKADAEKASRQKNGPVASRKDRVAALRVEKASVN